MSNIKNNNTQEVDFQFFGSLCDFLPKRNLKRNYSFTLLHQTSVKDAIESFGVPHVEVGRIKVNQQEVSFAYPLNFSDQVEVYPIDLPIINKSTLLRSSFDTPYKFILDVHLGSLARLLRLSGFDTYYETHAEDATIAKIAADEKRIVLTRDIGLLKHKIISWGYWIRSQIREEQFKEISIRFGLWQFITPFSFCLACNGKIQAVNKENIKEFIPQNTAAYFQTFFQCQNCLRVYWKGSHYEQMLKTLERLKMQSINQ